MSTIYGRRHITKEITNPFICRHTHTHTHRELKINKPTRLAALVVRFLMHNCEIINHILEINGA